MKTKVGSVYNNACVEGNLTGVGWHSPLAEWQSATRSHTEYTTMPTIGPLYGVRNAIVKHVGSKTRGVLREKIDSRVELDVL
jgi:hypothetical protein